MTTPSADFILEKNKEANQPLFLYTLEDYDGQSNNLRFAGSRNNVTFDGLEYIAFSITHEQVSENTQGQIDQVRLVAGNVSRLLQAYLEAYDLRGKKVTIKTVFRNLVADPDAFIEEVFYIESYVSTQEAIEFTLSSKFDILGVQLPLRLYNRNHCSWRFKGTECAYAGAATTCNKTLQQCRQYSNQQRFGGFPSIPFRRLSV